MDAQEFASRFDPLYGCFVNLAALAERDRPLLLAHYTSLEVLEKIIISNEIWFSNPLFMNDRDEIRRGVSEGISALNELGQDAEIIASVGGAENFAAISSAFHIALQNFDISYLLDVYVFCLSEYDAIERPHGQLSMWRGYGANGQGAAIVFNTQFLTITPGSPLLFAKVDYSPAAQRQSWVKETFCQCLKILIGVEITPETLAITGHGMFRLALIHSLLSKDPGFIEQQEWRVIYFPDLDKQGLMKNQRSYLRRGNIIEPKLKFPVEPLKLEPRQTWTFDTILERIVLGPSHGSILARNCVKRMLESLGKPGFADKVWVSEIPYRPPGV